MKHIKNLEFVNAQRKTHDRAYTVVTGRRPHSRKMFLLPALFNSFGSVNVLE